MSTIIQEIAEEIIKNNATNLEELLTGHKDISKFIMATKKMLDEVGASLVKNALEEADVIIRESDKRKKSWHVQRKKDPKTLITIFGAVNYKRTYYKHKNRGSYCYLSDEALGIDPYERMDLSFKAALVEKSLDTSYQKSGESISEEVQVSKQTVMNCIREVGALENKAVEVGSSKKIDVIYIEADEDHVAMQDGTNKEIKLVYVHEGVEPVSKKRNRLVNPRYFAGSYSNSEKLWLEVANYLEEAYEMDEVKKVYISGDGALWIKEGLNWIQNSVYVLDTFHLSKYVKIATAHMSYTRPYLWEYINRLEKENVEKLLKIIIDETESETKKEAVKESLRYIRNNWEGIVRGRDAEYIGCSAEGHVSHLLSARLSSRPLGWSIMGADQMARLRVCRENGGNIYSIIDQKTKNQKKSLQRQHLNKKIIKKRLSRNSTEKNSNLTIVNIGKKTVAFEFLKSIRGA